MTTDNPLYSELVKRLDDKCLRLITMVFAEGGVSNEDERMAEFVDDRGDGTDTYNLCCESGLTTQIGSADMGENFQMVPGWWPYSRMPGGWSDLILDAIKQARAIEAMVAERDRFKALYLSAFNEADQRVGEERGALLRDPGWLARAVAEIRQGESDTPRCEPPSDFAVNTAREWVDRVLSAIRSRSNATGEEKTAPDDKFWGSERHQRQRDFLTARIDDTFHVDFSKSENKNTSTVGFSDEEVEEALRPFAEAADGIPPSIYDGAPMGYVSRDAIVAGTVRTVCVGDFRRARAVLTHLRQGNESNG